MEIEEILIQTHERLGIDRLNNMQRQVLNLWTTSGDDMVLYSPTGSGKTLAFALCLLQAIAASTGQLQAVVMAPTRELVIQIAEVLRRLATGLKVTSCYGGHAVADEKASLAVTPDVVVATPGRLLDHVKRDHVNLNTSQLLVLDEMDKSLELGFEDEMRQLIKRMPHIQRRLLVSATPLEEIPDCVGMRQVHVLNLLEQSAAIAARITVWQVMSDSHDKLECLCQLLLSLDNGKIIVFTNSRESAQAVHRYLIARRIEAGLYHGDMDQQQRENVIAMLGNGSIDMLVATDLAARGLDIDNVNHIIHYHLPMSERAYLHRNGRTARVNATGNVYCLTAPNEELPAWVNPDHVFLPHPAPTRPLPAMATLYFQAGKKEKISRGDILGFIINNGCLDAHDIGHIDVKSHYALAAVPRAVANELVAKLRPHKIKGKKVRISLLNKINT